VTERSRCFDRLEGTPFDVLVVGGGINGAVSAAALSAHGVSTALVEAADFGSGTSQESSNLVWGGIKYLESFEIGLVRELCKSRNLLMSRFPTRVRETRFLCAVERGFRHSPYQLWLGTWLYWVMGNGATRTPRWIGVRSLANVEPAVDPGRHTAAVEYSDAVLADNDARFVFGFVRRALDAGAVAVNYCRCEKVRREGDLWHAEVRNLTSGERRALQARVLVNACGPAADRQNTEAGVSSRYRHLLSKGVHLLVERVSESGRVLAFFASDGRLFFAIPMGSRTCIGTTDTPVDSPDVRVTEADRTFLLENANAHLRLRKPLSEADIIAERCGVRPLVVERGHETVGSGEDFLQLSRRHRIEVEPRLHHLTLFGGKLTDCLNVGTEVCEHLQRLGVLTGEIRDGWFGEEGEQARADFFARAARLGLDTLPGVASGRPLAERLWRRYGSSALSVLDGLAEDRALAEPLFPGADFVRGELRVVAEKEMVVTLEDLLRRRTMLSLVLCREILAAAPGLEEAARVLFPGDPEMALDRFRSAAPEV